MKLSIIIPAYNEEKTIPIKLERYIQFFKKIYNNNFEIMVVLNKCTDNTKRIVKEFQKTYPQIKLRTLEKKGKGLAIMHGFKHANGELIGFVDADHSTQAPSFYDLIKNLNDYDGIIASRWIKGAKINIKQPLSRRIASRAFNYLNKILFQIKLRDTQCGAKLFKKSAIKKVLPNLGVSEWGFDIDLLYQLKRKKFKVKEIPTIWNDNPDSKLDVLKTGYEMFLSSVRLRLVYSPFKFIVQAYNILSDIIHKK